METKVITVHRAEIIWVTKTHEEPNYDFCEKFYEKEPFIVVIRRKDATRKFDSNSNVIEVDNEEEFDISIFESLENNKIVVVYRADIKKESEEYTQFHFFHIIPDTEICNTTFKIVEE